MRYLRILRIMRSLSKSTADCTQIKHKYTELMLRTDLYTMLISRDSASVSPTAVQSQPISQNSQKSQNSHFVRLYPAALLTAMPCNKTGMDIPPAPQNRLSFHKKAIFFISALDLKVMQE